MFNFNICHPNINLFNWHSFHWLKCSPQSSIVTAVGFVAARKMLLSLYVALHPGCHNRGSPKKERLPKTNSVTRCALRCSGVEWSAKQLNATLAEGRPLAPVSLCVETSQCQATLGPWGQFGNILARRKFYFWQNAWIQDSHKISGGLRWYCRTLLCYIALLSGLWNIYIRWPPQKSK